MKNFIHPTATKLCLLFLVFSLKIMAQKGLYDVRFTVKNFDCQTKVATIAVQVKANSADKTFLMGDANYRFDFDPRQMRNPRIVSQDNFSNLAPASDPNYGTQNLNGTSTGTSIGTVSLNTFYNNANNGAKTVAADWITISCIDFDIQNGAECFSLKWHKDTDFPITGMSEVELLESDYKLTVVPASGFFGNIEKCDLKSCDNKAPILTIPSTDIGKQDTALRICGTLSDDAALDKLTTSMCKAPMHGTITPSVSGNQICLNYIPNPGFYGADEICVKVCDEQGLCVEKTITLDIKKVTPPNPCENDKIPPVFTIVDPLLKGLKSGDTLTVNCENMRLFDSLSLSATDNSGFVYPIRFIDVMIKKGICPIDGYKMLMECDWIAKDSCGNEAKFKIYIKILDNKPPVFSNSAPANTTVNLNNGSVIPSTPTLSATDNCGTATVTFKETKANMGTGCDYILTRTWTAIDECGNTATTVQQITVLEKCPCDKIPPVITFTHPLLRGHKSGDTLSFNCDNIPIFDSLSVSVTDNSGSVNPVRFFDIPTKKGVCTIDGFKYLIECDWIATDNCGNEARVKIYLKITDNKPPVFSNSAPANITVNLNNGGTMPSAPTLSATDNCGTATVTFKETKANMGTGCDYILTRTWTATDECGNIATTAQQITVLEKCPCDKIPPVITFTHPLLRGHKSGDTLSFDCANPPVFDSLSVTATDESGISPTVKFVDIATKLGICPVDGYKVFMECDWIATDNCGNEARVKIYIKITDDKAPVFTSNLPKDITINLNNGETIPTPATLAATDNCGAPSLKWSETKTPTGTDCDYIIKWTWIATDECGNVTQHTQNILVKSSIVLNYTVIPETCPKNNGTISMSLTAYTYRWSDNQTGASRTGLKTGSYTVTATSSTGCSKTMTIAVKDSCPCVSFLTEKSMLKILDNCDAAANVCIKVKKDMVKGYYDNDVYHVGGITACEDGNTSISLKKGNHQIVIVNTEGCKDTLNVKVVCLTPDQRIINLKVGDTDTSCIDLSEMVGTRFRINKILTTQNNNALFNLLGATSCVQTSGLAVGQERATFLLSDEIGLTDTTYFIANVLALAKKDDPKILVIHNGFSPNGDGLNDYFHIENIEKYPNNDLTIYNRWGNNVYNVKQYQNDWVGTWQSNLLPDGTYFYILNDGEGNRYSGYLQIQR
jgi:gliding motility-associated-like protein